MSTDTQGESTHNRMKADADWSCLVSGLSNSTTFVFEVYFGPTDNDWNLQFIRNCRNELLCFRRIFIEGREAVTNSIVRKLSIFWLIQFEPHNMKNFSLKSWLVKIAEKNLPNEFSVLISVNGYSSAKHDSHGMTLQMLPEHWRSTINFTAILCFICILIGVEWNVLPPKRYGEAIPTFYFTD